MLIVKDHRYITKHVIGGSGIFATIERFIKGIFRYTAARRVASKLAAASNTEIGKKATSAVKRRWITSCNFMNQC
jgi:hypothetical protein